MTVMLLRSLSLSRYHHTKYRRHFAVLCVGAAVMIFVLALLPQDQAPQLNWSDKLNHIAAFMVLAFLLRMGFRISYFQSLGVLLGYGMLIEAAQYFTPDRSAEWADIGADMIGSLVGLKLYKYFGIWV